VTTASLPTRVDDKYRLLLTLAKAANSQLEFFKVLEAICDSLQPYVRVDAIGVLTKNGDGFAPQELHMRGFERDTRDGWSEDLSRIVGSPPDEVKREIGRRMSAPESGFNWVARHQKMDFGVTSDGRYPENEFLHGMGVRTFVRAPLIVHNRFLGVLHFMRAKFLPPEPAPFTQEEADFLNELAPSLAGTISNSLAYEEIKLLKRQTEMENVYLREDFDEQLMFGDIIGTSAPLRKVLASIQKVAGTDSTVLITGETGTGKELVAREIHRGSKRAARPMIKVNCAALPENLVASELFGHEKGAFTGALQRRIGRFELASKGTLFLDEIGELAPDVQASLLRVLQEGEFERVGGTQTLRADTRLITATNRDLQGEVARGKFRSDLFYRLSVFPISVPSLRERRADIPLLVEYFVSRHAQRLGKDVKSIEKASIERLTAYDWPGNP
jgi:formate hydrogenlyase transcriptional activator